MCADYQVEIVPDDCGDMPWERSDCHGPVRRARAAHREGSSDKRPGERPLNSAGRGDYQFYYDWAEASRMARRDGWGGDNPVQADFDYLRSFLSGDWEYVGVIVTDPETCESASAWGIESDAREYIDEVTRELIDEIESRRAEHEATLDAAIAGL